MYSSLNSGSRNFLSNFVEKGTIIKTVTGSYWLVLSGVNEVTEFFDVNRIFGILLERFNREKRTKHALIVNVRGTKYILSITNMGWFDYRDIMESVCNVSMQTKVYLDTVLMNFFNIEEKYSNARLLLKLNEMLGNELDLKKAVFDTQSIGESVSEEVNKSEAIVAAPVATDFGVEMDLISESETSDNEVVEDEDEDVENEEIKEPSMMELKKLEEELNLEREKKKHVFVKRNNKEKDESKNNTFVRPVKNRSSTEKAQKADLTIKSKSNQSLCYNVAELNDKLKDSDLGVSGRLGKLPTELLILAYKEHAVLDTKAWCDKFKTSTSSSMQKFDAIAKELINVRGVTLEKLQD